MKDVAMKKNEIRVCKVFGEAINELLWELLNKEGDLLLDIPSDSDIIFHMNYQKERDELVFYALEFGTPCQVDFESIDRYIDAHVEFTTNSIFDPEDVPYESLSMNEVLSKGVE